MILHWEEHLSADVVQGRQPCALDCAPALVSPALVDRHLDHHQGCKEDRHQNQQERHLDHQQGRKDDRKEHYQENPQEHHQRCREDRHQDHKNAVHITTIKTTPRPRFSLKVMGKITTTNNNTPNNITTKDARKIDNKIPNKFTKVHHWGHFQGKRNRNKFNHWFTILCSRIEETE